jgi:hypothetical protein
MSASPPVRDGKALWKVCMCAYVHLTLFCLPNPYVWYVHACTTTLCSSAAWISIPPDRAVRMHMSAYNPSGLGVCAASQAAQLNGHVLGYDVFELLYMKLGLVCCLTCAACEAAQVSGHVYKYDVHCTCVRMHLQLVCACLVAQAL